ncbi:hypothetical protein G9A89_000792, partial [Geosiphon pyriformis]
AESKKEEEELEDQEFTYQHPITENPEVKTPNSQTQQNLNLENSEIKTPNHQRQNNPNPKLINQQNLPLVIVIDQPPINPIAELIQQPLQLPLQQPVQQQLLQQPPQPPNLDPMAYTPIAKLDNFTGKEDDAQILNQFIRGLHSSILQHVHPLHSGTLQDVITCTRDFESTELEANHAQAINLVMNELSELDSKLEKLITQSSVYQSPVYQAPIYQLQPQSWRLAMVVHQLISISSQQPSGLCQWNLGAGQLQNLNSQNYLSLLVTPEDTSTNNPAFIQKQPLTSNIPPATITEDESLAAIFPFKFEKTTTMLLFNGAILKAKPITAMYIDTKVKRQSIKLIFDTASAKIITADEVTKTPIGEIDDFLFEVNGIMTPIKVLLLLVMTGYPKLMQPNILGPTHTCTSHVWPFQNSSKRETIDRTGGEERETYLGSLTRRTIELGVERKKEQREKEEGRKHSSQQHLYPIHLWLTKFYCHACHVEHFGRPKQPVEKLSSTKECEMTFQGEEEHGTCLVNTQSLLVTGSRKKHPSKPPGKELYSNWTVVHMTTMNYDASPEEIKTIKNNPPESPVINFLEPEEFHEHYQNLAPTREEQEQRLAQLNTRLCCYCLILSDFEYCDNCDLIYNPPPRIIYMIPEEEEPISSCALESESLINRDLDSNNDDENTDSSSVQNSNNNKNDSNSDSNSNLNYEQYIALPDFFKKQELKWYSNNGEGIMPECVHDTDIGFDLRYSEKKAIKLEPHLRTCIDLKHLEVV